MDIRDLDRRAGAVLGEVVMQVRPEHLWFPTPCPDWTVRGLLRHLVSENEGFAAAALNGSAPVQAWNGGRLGTTRPAPTGGPTWASRTRSPTAGRWTG